MQKLQLWTAGSISKEPRGLNVKNWAELQLLLNCSGLRVNSRKVQGLFRKTARPKRYLWIWAVGYRSNGARWLDPRSNLGRCIRIWRFRAKGRGGGGGTRRRRVPAAAGGRRWPISAFPGWIRAGLGSRSTYAACVGHWWRQEEDSRLRA